MAPTGHIPPTVGRHVDYYRTPDHWKAEPKRPYCAHIVNVNGDGTINVVFWNEMGSALPVQHVVLLQHGEQVPDDRDFATWMPYQIGQAQKTEQLQLGTQEPK
jgi:hypothetical protein